MEHTTAEVKVTLWSTLWPRPIRLLYICKDQDLREATIWIWLNRVIKRNDRSIAHLPSLVGMLYGFDSQAASQDPEVKPTVH